MHVYVYIKWLYENSRISTPPSKYWYEYYMITVIVLNHNFFFVQLTYSQPFTGSCIAPLSSIDNMNIMQLQVQTSIKLSNVTVSCFYPHGRYVWKEILPVEKLHFWNTSKRIRMLRQVLLWMLTQIGILARDIPLIKTCVDFLLFCNNRWVLLKFLVPVHVLRH